MESYSQALLHEEGWLCETSYLMELVNCGTPSYYYHFSATKEFLISSSAVRPT